METKYRRLVEGDGAEDNQLSTVENVLHQHVAAETDSINIKVLNKEATIEINDISKNATILGLKEIIFEKCDVPIDRQRLIFNGRPLKPDEKCLDELKVISGSCVHLFPIPVTNPVVPGTNNSIANPPGNLPFAPSMNIDFPSHTPEHFNVAIQMSSREVRLWNLLLLFTSATTLMNNITYFLAKGIFYKSLNRLCNLLSSIDN